MSWRRGELNAMPPDRHAKAAKQVQHQAGAQVLGLLRIAALPLHRPHPEAVVHPVARGPAAMGGGVSEGPSPARHPSFPWAAQRAHHAGS